MGKYIFCKKSDGYSDYFAEIITGKLHLELKQPEGVEHNEKEAK